MTTEERRTDVAWTDEQRALMQGLEGLEGITPFALLLCLSITNWAKRHGCAPGPITVQTMLDGNNQLCIRAGQGEADAIKLMQERFNSLREIIARQAMAEADTVGRN